MSPELEYAEEWLPVVDYEGWYQVSNLGRVQSLPRLINYSDGRSVYHKGIFLRPFFDRKGYLVVGLRRNVSHKRGYVHQLVAAAFIGLKPSGLTIDHKDGNRTNNAFWNLEYVTHTENMRRASALNLMKIGESHPNTKLTDFQISELRRLYTEGATYKSLAALFGTTVKYVGKILSHKSRKSATDGSRISKVHLHGQLDHQRGENNPQAKLTWDEVGQIRQLYMQGMTHTAIGVKFGVSRRLIGMIVTGQRWPQSEDI